MARSAPARPPRGGGLPPQPDEQRLVVGVALAPESRDEVLRRDALDELGRANERVAATGTRFLGDPGEVLARVLAVRQDVDGVLEGDGAHLREALPDLGPEVERARGELVDEQEPRGGDGNRRHGVEI